MCAFRLAALIGAVAGLVPQLCRADADGPGYPLIRSITALEVGAETAGWSGVQDADGVLYFGSYSLVRYDGDRWRSFPINGSYAIRSLDWGPNRRLWAGAIGEIGWFAESKGEWRYQSLRGYLPADHPEIGDVWHALAWGDGAVFASEEYLLRWDGRELKSWSFPGSRHLQAFRVGADILFQYRPKGLFILRENGPELIAPSTLIGDLAIFWIGKTDGGWLLLKNDGLFRLAHRGLNPVGETANAYLKKHGTVAAKAMPDGRLAIGTMDDGIAFITQDGRLTNVLNSATGFGAGSA
ncbi:MAG TPA: hypothetical protein VM029_01915, partial [Opitutaceae bacterium]|nr:hypothetical protein [Opitutaceae bacterium]